MLTGFLLQMCGFATINRGDWISMCALVVLLSVTIAAMVYAIGNFLPGEKREKLKGAVRYEIIEALISLIIIFVLIAFAAFSCTAGGALLGYKGYMDVFNSADNYVGSLLFTNGLSITGNIYTISQQYDIVSGFLEYASGAGAAAVTAALHVGYGPLTFQISTSANFFFSKISTLFTGVYVGMLDATFAGLFILFLLLKIIEAGALTVVAPIAILMRSLSFMGPQLRRTSNLFLGMAIGLYFVLPLMVAFNSYVASCLNISTGIVQPVCSYPYFSDYLKPYVLPAMSTSIFTSSTTYPIDSTQLPGFVGSGAAMPISIYTPALNMGQFGQFISIIFEGPTLALQYGTLVAGYLFLGIVLVALDIGVTAGFVIGISKGLDSIGNVFGGGPFFGG